MTVTVLYGRDHTTLGEVATTTAGRTAAALSPGRFPKGYPHTEPNEDCVAVADLNTHLLLAVADGHGGADASHAAISAIVDCAASLEPSDPSRALTRLTDAVVASIGALPADSPSRTALTVVLFDAHKGVAFTFGDTYLIRLRNDKGRRLNRPAPFLDRASNIEDARFDRFSLRPADRIVAATDGLIDFLGRGGIDRLGTLSVADPSAWVAAAADLALTGGAGDNVGLGFGGW